MKKKLLIAVLFFVSGLVKSQTFNFTFNSDATGTPYVYQLQTTIKVIGIKITQVFYDNGANSYSSFAYALVLSYTNTVTGTNIPPSGSYFYNYQMIPTSTGKDANNNTLPLLNTGNISIPITTNSNSNYMINQSSTYFGSASLLGYVSGQTYSDAATLTRFGYNTMTLNVHGIGLASKTITVTSGSGILPITLKSFTAILKGGDVLLNWTTATETNNSYFTIERSANSNNFEALQKIASKGNSNTEANYSFTDYAPLAGIAYYRLKQTDLDGQSTYSNIISINNIQTGNDKIIFYPTINPSNIVHVTGVTINKTLDIFSTTGAEIFTAVLQGSQVALPNLAKGIYFFKVTSVNNTTQITKYIQQ